MSSRLVLVAGLAGVLGLSACAATERPPAPTVSESTASSAKGGSRDRAITIRATVEKVDVKARKVSLKGFDGTRETIRVSDDVRNLAQMKKGDVVVVTYYQSIAFEVLRKGDKRPEAGGVGAVGRVPEGEKPGGIAAESVTVVAEILKLDRAHDSAELRGPDGKVFSVDVRNPENFDKVKVGDKVEITYTEAVGIDVQAAPKP